MRGFRVDPLEDNGGSEQVRVDEFEQDYEKQCNNINVHDFLQLLRDETVFLAIARHQKMIRVHAEQSGAHEHDNEDGETPRKTEKPISVVHEHCRFERNVGIHDVPFRKSE